MTITEVPCGHSSGPHPPPSPPHPQPPLPPPSLCLTLFSRRTLPQVSGGLLDSKDGLHWCFVLGEVGLYLLATGAEVGEIVVSTVTATRQKLLGAKHPLTVQVETEARRLAAGP